MNHRLHGGCQVPIAAHALLQDDDIHLRGLVGAVDGTRILRAEVRGSAADPEALGIEVAEQLLAQGAAELLAVLHD